MEVVPAQRPAFQRSNVQEWSRLDQLTGVLERGRMQTDHWASGSRRYGKAVDSRVRSLTGSNVQQRQHKQLEVFQSQGPGGSLQVVRSSLTTSSSSSGTVWRPSTDFENLPLPLNPLDSSPQKTRASVGRSGSIGARRPPTRLRHLAEKLDREELEIEVPTPTITPDDGSEARQKSSSTEDLEKADDDDEDAVWRRSAKIRRSLQFSSKAPALRTDSALKGLEALENVFRRGANIADSVNKTLAEGSDASGALDADSLANHLLSAQGDAAKKNSKRHSFVTVESLKEVRDRLRPLNGFGKNSDENDDDGIVTEDVVEPPVSRVKSYVYGMEALVKKPIPATGSLESRSSNGRSEEWYNRRKSYGFEQMQGQEVSFKPKGIVESSTDSGICRSTETVTVAAPARKTVVTLGSDVSTNGYHHDEHPDPRRSSEPVTITIPITSDDKPKNVVEEKCLFYRQITEGTSVSVENKVNGEKRFPIKKNSVKNVLNSPDLRYVRDSWKDPEPGLKRHSIAVDDTRFVKEESPSVSTAELAKKFNSLLMARKDTVTTGINIAFVQNEEKRHKKVEFCKTEVHFVADSGRVNIVETDEKPPPTTMFRRRRRPTGVVGMTASPAEPGVGSLPETRFGDSPYEKQLLGGADEAEKDKDEGVLAQVGGAAALEPKSILKNYQKPRPFHLGDDTWGVKLRPVNSSSSVTSANGDGGVVWKSSVSVRSTTFDTPQEAGTTELHKLLRSLRPAHKKSDGSDAIEEGSGVQVKVGGSSPAAAAAADVRRPWSVADRVRQVEEMKGFSTKVNFGAGEATVVAEEEPASPRSFWLAKGTPGSDEKKMSNGKEGLVVRIGERERSEKEEIAKKQNKTTTITIDLKAASASAAAEKGGRCSLQAPGLIMRVAAPSQLAALKQLYSASDDSADEEVRSYMGGDDDDDDHDRASEVSGSWSRVRALRNVAAYRTGTTTTSLKTENSHVSVAPTSIPSFDQPKLINTRSARPKITSISLRYEGEPDSPKVNNTDQRRYTAPSSSDLFQSFAAKSTNLKANTSPSHRDYENCNLVNNGVEHEIRNSPVKYSHVKENGVSSYDEHFSLPEKEAVEVAAKKASPEILFQSSKQTKTKEEPSYVNVDLGGEAQPKLSQISSRFSREASNARKSSSPLKSPTRDTYKIHTGTYIKENAVDKYNWKLGSERKESEILVSSAVPNEVVPARQVLSNEFGSGKGAQKSWKEVQRVNNSTVTVESKRGGSAAVNSRSKRVENKETSSGPVYENTEIISQEIKKSARQRSKVESQEHDSSIMEELTRAADEILRAVNGYTDDESNRASSEDDDHDGIRRNKRSKAKAPPSSRRLGTIAEAPGGGNRAPRRDTVASSAKRKQPTSSTSSVESVRAVSSRTARLLQRASSREKLLQRRASSSEDADADPRKTRPSSRPQHRKPTEATRLKERVVNKRVVPQHRIQHERSGRATAVKKDSQELKTTSTRRTVDKVPGNSVSTARDRRERQSAVPSCATKKISSSSRSEGNLQAKVPNKV